MQVDSDDKYPWIAQLIVKDSTYGENPLYASACSASLVKLFVLLFRYFCYNAYNALEIAPTTNQLGQLCNSCDVSYLKHPYNWGKHPQNLWNRTCYPTSPLNGKCPLLRPLVWLPSPFRLGGNGHWLQRIVYLTTSPTNLMILRYFPSCLAF